MDTKINGQDANPNMDFKNFTSEYTNSDTESLEEEIEPKLKYCRLSNDLQSILPQDAASCIAVHPKFICLGSHWGVIHILDHQGDKIEGKGVRAHSVAVNQISIDSNGDFIATCSDDGKVFIHSLYSDDGNYTMNMDRPIKTVALDPNYNKPGSNRRFVTGSDKLTLHERTWPFLGRLKSTLLCESEGAVRSLCWGENFIAFSSDIGVRVYDINARCSLGLIKWERPMGMAIEKFKCNLRWADSRTLLIGWVDTVRVCVIRKRSNIELANRDLPEYLVDPVSTFKTEFYISGIAPLDHQLVLLGFSKELDQNQKSLRPQLYIVEYRDNDYIDICTDSLSLRGYQEYKVNDYHVDVLIDENRFFIVAPRDVVVASPYDLDDRIQWLIQHNKFEEALDSISRNNGKEAKNFTIESVGIAYLDHLLNKKQFDAAGRLCLKIFGNKKKLWGEQIFKFAKLTQLRSVSPYIPRTLESKLDPHIYEMVLYEYLQMDAKGFLNLVKEWNPQLYNTYAVINAVLERLLVSDYEKEIYLEALAMLYSYERKYDKSLSMYLKLKNVDVFNLIKKHNLYNVIHDMIIELMDLNPEITIELLLQQKHVPSEVVVEKLKNHELYLYRYLDALDKKEKKYQYHGMLVRLYAIFERSKLLPFLKRSDHYPIQEALDICQKEKYYPEMVYLLDRIGDTKEALQLIIEELKDIEKAFEFCKEHNDYDLWNDLITHALKKPEYITYLLQHIGTYQNPIVLVEQIEDGKEIPGLKKSLVKMLKDYSLQASVEESFKKILLSDYFNLHEKLVNLQQRGIPVTDEVFCGACHRKIITRDLSGNNNVIVFNCKHGFHELCIPDSVDFTSCTICYPTKMK
ncbi:vacuolar protein sorting-associated protein 41 homolog [Agrilus planipennis]|uniref:Vacuolar protein sorting-associated protein 41 homolog n=1 Tax=Agrilus planipennis TaxID=224129 RepID=A0A7F5R041_AGRPL|nr:vacuolar protein sorting-associated protein 41 homolog [Agrilus planipennis]XP_025830961.1 vacuolar protein sorting-associated protein 41 homolog [Agrilus planipennis]